MLPGPTQRSLLPTSGGASSLYGCRARGPGSNRRKKLYRDEMESAESRPALHITVMAAAGRPTAEASMCWPAGQPQLQRALEPARRVLERLQRLLPVSMCISKTCLSLNSERNIHMYKIRIRLVLQRRWSRSILARGLEIFQRNDSSVRTIRPN